ncbi:MAG: hypothetical protein ACXVB5_23060, partial [Isosphaeraceae bacterium]
MSNLEIDIQKKRRFLTEADEAARAGLSRLEIAGYTTTILVARHELSRVLVSLARTESESTYKRKLLEEALGHWALVIEGFK